jgi:hypothetical protein
MRPVAAAEASAERHHRLVVLSDIEADPDDTQSFVRLLLYANSIDIGAMIAATSVHQTTRVAPESIRRVIEAYGKVRDNLLLHEAAYPEAQVLLARVTLGLSDYGPAGIASATSGSITPRLAGPLRRSPSRTRRTCTRNTSSRPLPRSARPCTSSSPSPTGAHLR